MIVWLNGAFGSGKTTTATHLAETVPDAKLFDPEYVGYMLTPFLTSPTGDFQDLPLWRHLVIETMAGLAQQYPHPWIAPMSLIHPPYRTEILTGLRTKGATVHEFILQLDEPALRARIDADQNDVNARQWRHDHVPQALTSLAAATDATVIDATQPPAAVAAAITTHLGL
jgi:hypothetical protein